MSFRHVIGSVSKSQTCYWFSGRTEFNESQMRYLFSQSVSDVLLVQWEDRVQSVSLRRVIGSVSQSQTCYWFSGRTEFSQ